MRQGKVIKKPFMSDHRYYVQPGGHPPQTQLLTGRAVLTEAYAVIPRGVQRDIVTSSLPHWQKARFWVLARPMTGFSETFSHYIGDLEPGGGCIRPEAEAGIEAALFVVAGAPRLDCDGRTHDLEPGSFVYLPPDLPWALTNGTGGGAQFHWFRKQYQPVDGVDMPPLMVTHEDRHPPDPMPDCAGAWATTRFVERNDVRYDMHVSIVTLQPGASIPFSETHVMEHGLFVLEGKGVYRLNRDWVEVEAGDYMWLRAFCPQACYAGGPGPFRYLLYKDVNRHVPMLAR